MTYSMFQEINLKENLILWFKILIWGCLFIILSSQTVQANWAISIKEVACVQNDVIRLEEIAEPIKQYPREKWSYLASKELWKSPQNRGRPLVIPKYELQRLLAYYLGEDIVSKCLLPKQLRLQKGGKVLRQEQVYGLVVDFLTEKTSAWEGEVKLRDLRLPDYIFLRRKSHKIKCSLSSSVKPGRNSIRLQVMDMRDQKVHTLTGSVFLDVWRALPCAKRPLNRSEPLRPQDITFKRKNIAYVRHDVWDGKGGPWRMSRSVGEGQIIYSRNIEPLPVICEGEEITLKYKGDFIQLQVPALALDDANVGESIKVQNLQSKKRIYGRVKDSKTVVVN